VRRAVLDDDLDQYKVTRRPTRTPMPTPTD
jgi:hypothetical protein